MLTVQNLLVNQMNISTPCASCPTKLILREGPDTIGTFIAEPVLGTGGITPPTVGWICIF